MPSDGKHRVNPLGEKKMKHFSVADWVDFARGIVTNDRKGAMQAHLDSGCKRCNGELRAWKRVGEIAWRDRSYEPPDNAIGTAKSLLPIHGRPGRAPVVQLLFDSFQRPVIAGVRSTATTARQVLYGVGTYRIDLRMEPQTDSDKISLVGQVLNAADPVQTGAEVTVTLLRGRKVVAESQSNALGEFQLECTLEGDLHLLVTLPRARDIKIPLLVPSKSSVTGLLEDIDSERITRDFQKGKSTRRRV